MKVVYSPKEDIHITPSKAQWTFVEEEVERKSQKMGKCTAKRHLLDITKPLDS